MVSELTSFSAISFLANTDALAGGFGSDVLLQEESLLFVDALVDSYAASGLERGRLLLKLNGFRTALERNEIEIARCLGSQIASAIRARPRTFQRLLPRIHFQLFGDVQAALRANHQPDLTPAIEYPPRYSVLRQLEEGGMARVYLAEYRGNKKVAIKVLEDDRFVAQFAREVRILKRLRHPHIIRLIDDGDNLMEAACVPTMSDPPFFADVPFFVMEFGGEKDLADKIAEQPQLSWKEIQIIAVQLAEALGAAHAQGIVHRDLKPENVVLRNRGGRLVVKLIDFGHALDLRDEDQRRKERGQPKGTPAYMSPEQIRGGNIDGRTDIYLLGVLLFELMTGELPFQGTTVEEVARQHLNDPPPSPRSICPDLQISACAEAIVLKALAKNPDDRFQSMAEMAEAIKALLP